MPRDGASRARMRSGGLSSSLEQHVRENDGEHSYLYLTTIICATKPSNFASDNIFTSNNVVGLVTAERKQPSVTPFQDGNTGTFSFLQCKNAPKMSFLLPRSVIPATSVTRMRNEGLLLLQTPT